MKVKDFFASRKSPYKNTNPRVRKSYYTFSEEYPAGNIPIERRMQPKFKSIRAKNRFYVILALVVVCLSFFAVRLALDISYKPAQVLTSGNVADNSTPSQSILVTDGFRALYMPYDKLSDTSYIKSFIKKIRRYDCNSVIIDFKTESGKLCYSSLNSHAINGKCAVFNNNTVRQALSIFKKENITVTARIYCFLDNTVPVSNPELSVKYMDTDVNWIDATDDGNVKTWLNPCSKEALTYLLDIITEVRDFGIKSFILEKCHFPDSTNTAGASYPGEKNFRDKNAALRLFIKEVKAIVPEDGFLIVSQSATDALKGNKQIYFGSISTASFDALATYTINRPDGIFLDKKTDFSSMLGLFSSISEVFKNKTFVPVIDYSEYSGKYLRTVRKNNYKSYIIFDENGEY